MQRALKWYIYTVHIPNPKACVLQKQSNSQTAVDAGCIREYLYKDSGANLSCLISDIKANPPFFFFFWVLFALMQQKIL